MMECQNQDAEDERMTKMLFILRILQILAILILTSRVKAKAKKTLNLPSPTGLEIENIPLMSSFELKID